MSENDKKSAPAKFPTAVVITSIICSTIVVLTVVSMIYSWAMVDHVADKWLDNLPDNITINTR